MPRMSIGTTGTAYRIASPNPLLARSAEAGIPAIFPLITLWPTAAHSYATFSGQVNSSQKASSAIPPIVPTTIAF